MAAPIRLIQHGPAHRNAKARGDDADAGGPILQKVCSDSQQAIGPTPGTGDDVLPGTRVS